MVMRARHLNASVLVLCAGAIAIACFVKRSSSPSESRIVADPTPDHPRVVMTPGAAPAPIPMRPQDVPFGPPRTRPHTPFPQPITIDPYDGTDYAPQLKVLAEARARRDLDRQDVYDPSVYHAPITPVERHLDEADPWGGSQQVAIVASAPVTLDRSGL
jgi:hypothetical protein